MDQFQEFKEEDSSREPSGARPNWWLFAAAIALIGVAGLGVGYGLREQGLVNQMTTREADTNATLAQMHSEIDSLTAKLSEMSAAQQAAAQSPAAAQSQAASQDSAQAAKKVTGSGRARSANGSKQMKQLQAQLADQKKQLLQTQEDLAQTRTDLETTISSTRDDLNGSIARTHEELVALARRGERNYFEFDLAKTKQFERSGPISLSLRKADAKHNRVDLQLIVDDSELSKKSVNLYEPVWIHRADDPQPIQVVINKIEKNRVHGYVSAPKYRQSELKSVSYETPGNSAPGSATPSEGSPGTPPGTKPPKE